jgi:hypothetical protein
LQTEVAYGTELMERDGKASGGIRRRTNPSGADDPSPLAEVAEVATQGGIPVRKLVVRVTAIGGGLVAVLLSGGAVFIKK